MKTEADGNLAFALAAVADAAEAEAARSIELTVSGLTERYTVFFVSRISGEPGAAAFTSAAKFELCSMSNTCITPLTIL